MTRDVLPAELESVPHSGRVRRAVELGRRSRTDPEAAAILRAWAGGGFTQRLLAAYACHGSRDAAALAGFCADHSRIVSHTALRILRDVGDDDTRLAVLRALPPRRLYAVLLRLRSGHPAVVDRFIDELAAGGSDDAWPLVPLGTPALIDRHLATAAERGGDTFWVRLARRHPDRAAAELVARLDAAAPDGLLFGNARGALLVLSDTRPDAALALVRSLHRHLPVAYIPLEHLVIRRPSEVADLVLAGTEPVPLAFHGVVDRLGVDRIIALYRRSPARLGAPEIWLGRLPAADRAAVYRELAPAWTSAEGLVAAAVLRQLPADLRAAEAGRMIELPALAARPLERPAYAGLLPWDEARAACDPSLGHPEGEHRAAALVALCEASRFDRARLADLLELLAARKYEQDPVRFAFLAAVAALPPGRWRSDHLPGLARLIRDGLDAADLSPASAAALGRLVFRVLPVHPDWAVEQIALVTVERGFPGWLGGVLTVEEVRRVAPALTAVLQAWTDREREPAVLGLAQTIGRRLPEWPELARALERLVRTSANDYVAAAAMTLVVRHLPAERERVVTETLARDGSWVLRPEVLAYLNRRRQDLLTPYLGHRTYAGRFSTGQVRHVLPVAAGFHRWTPTQQETFADSLAELAAPPPDPARAQVTWDLLFAVQRLALLPGIGPERLVRLARDPRPAVTEAAVRALGRLDARQGIPELLEALGDARARWAVYALRAALLDLPSDRVLATMRTVPLTKVTVAKEAVRLAGELGGPGCLDWFAVLHARPLHRDVRGALLRALWDHLEWPAAWAILDESADDPDPGVVIGLARIQAGRASAEARGRVADLLRRLAAHPEPTVRVAVLDRLALQPVPDPGRAVLAASLAALGSALPDERSAGLRAALALATDADAGRFGAAFTDLLASRRELAAAAGEFAARTRFLGERLVAVRSAVLEAVTADPAAVLVQVPLAAARLAPAPFAEWVFRLAGSSHWHVGTQAAVAAAVAGCGQPAADVERCEAVWARAADPALRWLALRALVLAAGADGWTADRRQRLAHYASDPDAAVADEAAFTFPPAEPKRGPSWNARGAVQKGAGSSAK
jgi:hypothetical protein